jgi:hypothetical protein
MHDPGDHVDGNGKDDVRKNDPGIRGKEMLDLGARPKQDSDSASGQMADAHEESGGNYDKDRGLVCRLCCVLFPARAPELGDKDGHPDIDAPGYAHDHKDHDLADAHCGDGRGPEPAHEKNVHNAHGTLKEAGKNYRESKRENLLTDAYLHKENLLA